MLKGISSKTLQHLFAGLSVGLSPRLWLPIQFFAALLTIANDVRPINAFLRRAGIHINDSCRMQLYDQYAAMVVAQAYHLVAAVIASKTRFRTDKTVFFFQLNQFSMHASSP